MAKSGTQTGTTDATTETVENGATNGTPATNGDGKRNYERKETIKFGRDSKNRPYIARIGAKDIEGGERVTMIFEKSDGRYYGVDDETFERPYSGATRGELIEQILVKFGALPTA